MTEDPILPAGGDASATAAIRADEAPAGPALGQAPQDGTAPAGAAPAGEMPAGVAPAGAMHAGAAPAGEMPAGEMPAGKLAAAGADVAAGPPALVRRAALAVITALAALSYFWAIGSDPLEGYYAAAVRSMSASWHDFIFGAFDPARTITIDKLPGAFWLQALSVRAFGLHTWAIALPQAVEGVLTVLVLYRAVRRLAGPLAGLIAALVIAASPATVALNRGNISDTLMILFLVLAADAVSGVIGRPDRTGLRGTPGLHGTPGLRGAGRLRGAAGGVQARLIAAGIWVGLAFQAKMIEAWLLLPALGLVVLIAAPGPALRRVRQVAVAGVVTALVSLSWMAAVSLVPAAHRPYVDGSHDDSLAAMVYEYNGLGRFGDQTPLQLLSSQSLGINLSAGLASQGPSAVRLLHGDLGRDTGWLLPAALIVAGLGIWQCGIRK